ncbi:hypothetical protein AB837_00608 [bacterium AB1]|nr:hypothetical protein AB837_00608 [bacterium AB1]
MSPLKLIDSNFFEKNKDPKIREQLFFSNMTDLFNKFESLDHGFLQTLCNTLISGSYVEPEKLDFDNFFEILQRCNLNENDKKKVAICQQKLQTVEKLEERVKDLETQLADKSVLNSKLNDNTVDDNVSVDDNTNDDNNSNDIINDTSDNISNDTSDNISNDTSDDDVISDDFKKENKQKHNYIHWYIFIVAAISIITFCVYKYISKSKKKKLSNKDIKAQQIK